MAEKEPPVALSRRRFLLWLLGAAAGLGGCCAGGAAYPWWIEPGWLQVTRRRVDVPGLPASLDGLTIAHLSDLHHGTHVPIERIGDAVRAVNRLQPDIVALTGDFVSGSASFAAPCAEQLRALQAASGVFACLGNHDHWTDAQVVARALGDAGIGVLRNTAQALAGAAEGLWIAGVDDVMEGQQDLARALAPVPEGAPVLLLAHEPDFADQVSQHAAPVVLQLSGHSHGGQVRLPFVGPLILPRHASKYPAGLYRVGDLALYTNRGLGVIEPAVRFNCRPEVTLLSLRSALSFAI